MEFCTYAVTGILSHDAVASVLAIALHRVAYITESAASDSRFDALIQALFCGVAQPLRFVGNLSGSESSGIIAVVAVNFGAEVNTDYVAVAGNPYRCKKFGSAPCFFIYSYAMWSISQVVTPGLTASPATFNASAEIRQAYFISSISFAVFSTIMLNPPML